MNNREPGLILKGHSERCRPSIGAHVLWGFLWQTMWLSAIFGPPCIVLGAISYFVDLPDWLSFSSRQTLLQIGTGYDRDARVNEHLRLRAAYRP